MRCGRCEAARETGGTVTPLARSRGAWVARSEIAWARPWTGRGDAMRRPPSAAAQIMCGVWHNAADQDFLPPELSRWAVESPAADVPAGPGALELSAG